MASLYQIDQEILSCIDFETGEIIDIERLNELQIERETKLENIALWIKNLKSDVNEFKIEIENLKQRQEVAKKKAERLEAYLSEILDGQKMVTPRVQVTFRNSESVQIVDENLIPKQYIKEKVETAPDKIAIKKAIKEGETVAGCELIVNTNMTVK